jgi:hypothetical protein
VSVVCCILWLIIVRDDDNMWTLYKTLKYVWRVEEVIVRTSWLSETDNLTLSLIISLYTFRPCMLNCLSVIEYRVLKDKPSEQFIRVAVFVLWTTSKCDKTAYLVYVRDAANCTQTDTDCQKGGVLTSSVSCWLMIGSLKRSIEAVTNCPRKAEDAFSASWTHLVTSVCCVD